MRVRRGTEQLRRGPRLLVSMYERELRKHQALAADDRIIEWKQGKIEYWSVAGATRPLPRAFEKLDVPQLRGVAGCCYSARRLFLGSRAGAFADLESVWHARSWDTVLGLVFSSPALLAVRWRSDEAEDAVALAAFAERIMAQRERRLVELPAESRQRAAGQLADLDRSGTLAAALAEVKPPAA